MLSGEAIPLAARIMEVADVFDALVNKRVCKEAMAEEEAYVILRRDAGSRFGPVIVNVSLLSVKRYTDIWRKA